VLRQLLKNTVFCVRVRCMHRPLKDRAPGEDDPVGAQPRTRLLHEILNVEVLGDLLDDPLAQPGVDCRIKRTPPKILRMSR
jgi:hypothetical protein